MVNISIPVIWAVRKVQVIVWGGIAKTLRPWPTQRTEQKHAPATRVQRAVALRGK